MGTNQKIRCRATPEKTGRTLSVYHVSLTDDEGLEVATGNFTFFMMDKRLNGTTPERLERTADKARSRMAPGLVHPSFSHSSQSA